MVGRSMGVAIAENTSKTTDVQLTNCFQTGQLQQNSHICTVLITNQSTRLVKMLTQIWSYKLASSPFLSIIALCILIQFVRTYQTPVKCQALPYIDEICSLTSIGYDDIVVEMLLLFTFYYSTSLYLTQARIQNKEEYDENVCTHTH